MSGAWIHRLAVPFALVLAERADAHAFGKTYTLPVPFWLYAYGAAATLALSFVLIGYFAAARGPVAAQLPTVRREAQGLLVPAWLIAMLRILALGLFVVMVASGLFGDRPANDSFILPFFWIAFSLGLAYLTAILGDVYAFLNPWIFLCDLGEKLRPGLFAGTVSYPARLGYWPALLLYVIYIWIELFGQFGAAQLAGALCVLAAVNIAGCWLFGATTWLRYGDVFAVYFRLIGLMAPVAYSTGKAIRVTIRAPFTGLIAEPVERQSLAVFILFMLASTAFDGAHETLPWVFLFWIYIYPLVQPLSGLISDRPYVVAPDFFYAWQWLSLCASPFVYFALFRMFVFLSGIGSPFYRKGGALALRFAATLIPIAFVYNVTHYYTLLLTEGAPLLVVASDPFGFGWNLFGTARWQTPAVIPDVGFVWHSQVALIVFGHIVSVYLAHLVALTLFNNRRGAVLSQAPMLVLMVILTTLGLWILSLPIASGQVVLPMDMSAESNSPRAGS